MKRKSLSLILAALLTASACLGGCGSDDGGSSAGNGSEEGGSAAESTQESSAENSSGQEAGDSAEDSQAFGGETAELEPVTIQFWIGGPGKQKDSDRVWEAFNEKLQEYVPNTTVEITCMPNAEYKEKYPQMLASGEAVDLTWIASWVTGSNQLIQDGNLMALDDLVEQYGQGIKQELGEEILDMHRYPADDKLYYLISWQGLYSNVRAFKIPTELAKLAGDTWLEDTQKAVTKWWNDYSSTDDLQAVFDQLDIYLGALKDNDQLYSGISQATFGAWLYPNRLSSESSLQMYNIGVPHMDNSFTVIDTIQSDHYRVYAENMAEFYKKGYIRSDIASLEKNTLSFVTGGEYTPNTTVIDVHNALTDNTADMYSATAGVDISLVQIENEGYLSRGDATAMAIPYCADEPERAMMVLNALYTEPELYQLLVYGFEGEHYTDNGDGTITTDYGAQGTSDSNYGLWKWTVGTCKNSLVTQADVPGYYDELLENEKDAIISSFVNFTFDDSNVTDVVASLKAIDGEYKSMIDNGYMGDEWETTLDKWIAERQAAGVDRLIEELQNQINAYVQENNITSWISEKE